MSERDEGYRLVLQTVGGLNKLADRLGIKRQSMDWRSVPQKRLFEVAELSGLDPARIRPDLADWIVEERKRARMTLARERFGLAIAILTPDPRAAARRMTDEISLDIMVAIAACRFVASERKVSFAAVMAGVGKEDQAARALAMALAHVVGRARSSNVGAMFGTTRQNVDNASERYLRARDGDDPDDVIGEGADGKARVIERGRVRRAKDAAEELWDLETRFAAALAGEGEQGRKQA